MKYDIVIVSGYFNPLHIGHLDYFAEAKAYGGHLVAIVNNDKQVKTKGTVPFMEQKQRSRIVRAMKYVDSAVISVDTDGSVIKSLRRLAEIFKGRSIVFATGADHTAENTTAETLECSELGIDILYGVGGGKVQSSSELLAKVK